MKRITMIVALLAMLGTVMISTVPAEGGTLTDWLFSSIKAKLAPAKACTSDVKNYSHNTKTTFQVAIWAHSLDTCVIGLNQLPSNFAGTNSFKIGNVNPAGDSVLFIDTIFGNGAWQYTKIYTWDSLQTALNTKFKVWNKATHDTIDSFAISVGSK